jgi:hypothetical protein
MADSTEVAELPRYYPNDLEGRYPVQHTKEGLGQALEALQSLIQTGLGLIQDHNARLDHNATSFGTISTGQIGS